MIRPDRDSWDMRASSPTITIFDLEFTAWECSMARHWLSPGEFKEVVQIGAVKLDAEHFQILDEFNVLVRPRINGTLSPYFEKLTGITNETLVREGVDFAPACRRFLRFANGDPIAAFGHDEWVLEDNIRLYGITDMPGLPAFHDLRGWFAGQGIDPRGLHSCDIGPLLGVPFRGQTHNALDDVRSIAAGMEVMAARGARLRPAA
ncbi:MAG TPA: 3'-5' exonuclease [Rhizomicrobium sp.]|jgi:inhibitor of KinA sporulation pathway (predicted exonuclease)|nr:3'-5' exonuclease [Rhizomicrobium sp.]